MFKKNFKAVYISWEADIVNSEECQVIEVYPQSEDYEYNVLVKLPNGDTQTFTNSGEEYIGEGRVLFPTSDECRKIRYHEGSAYALPLSKVEKFDTFINFSTDVEIRNTFAEYILIEGDEI
jgi:hypothetical protein